MSTIDSTRREYLNTHFSQIIDDFAHSLDVSENGYLDEGLAYE